MTVEQATSVHMTKSPATKALGAYVTIYEKKQFLYINDLVQLRMQIDEAVSMIEDEDLRQMHTLDELQQ